MNRLTIATVAHAMNGRAELRGVESASAKLQVAI